jgi:acetolactate synthase I/II/III large subunit
MSPGTPVRSAQRVIEGVAAHGVRYIFGIPGAKVDEVFDGLAGAHGHRVSNEDDFE